MKYDHIVKYHGVYYAAGTEVPEETEVIIPQAEMPGVPVSAEEHKYTKEELMAKTVKEIKALAAENGINITKTTKADVVGEFLEQQ